ncbi:YbhB/YbcL family Raf kinase inhibitor-like protein [Agromyces sp. ISL-38]|uniref:YbhB/YbcL family Raf kinase inhibitor-like protein n=1 Tax=Agromyces sp. ISL-38 TaxID=2819107 RepID=UPI0027E18FF7|nr:YbhB/YbcL family Raf kinase inhibitor-like protein [Agromyces sp. ISL-38]
MPASPDEADSRGTPAHSRRRAVEWPVLPHPRPKRTARALAGGFPAATRSFAVTCFDPDAPSVSGWWHWAVMNLSATQTSLPADAGAAGGENLPEGALMLANDDRERGYSGPTPTPGTGVHRYFFVVHALDVPQVDVSTDAALAALGLQLFFHGLGRGILVGTASAD